MNWRLLKRQTEVYFRKDDAICTLVPFPLALPEAVEPEFAEIDANPQLKLDFFHFTSRRSGNIIKTHESGSYSKISNGHDPPN
jgi:hypothetical protein